MSKRILFLSPHTKPAGGPKVLFRLAQYIKQNHDIDTVVGCFNPKFPIDWLGIKPNFEIAHVSSFDKYHLPSDVDLIVNFADGKSFGPLPEVPHVLYLQGFGTQQYGRECINLQYPYSAVLTTSKWLAKIAQQFGHSNIAIVPPAVDVHMKNAGIKGPKSTFTIGSLYHEAPDKNMDFFIRTMNKLRQSKNVQALFLSAKNPDINRLEETMACPYSVCIRPNQLLLPAVYSTCDVWFAPSRNEGFGLTVLESMACETPTAVLQSLGLDGYLKHEKNCMLLFNEDKRQAVSAINMLLEKETLRQTVVKGGKQLSDNFTWKSSAANFVAALQKFKLL